MGSASSSRSAYVRRKPFRIATLNVPPLIATWAIRPSVAICCTFRLARLPSGGVLIYLWNRGSTSGRFSCLLLLALGLRLGFALSRDASDGSIASLPDQREYLDLGRSLRSGDGLSMADPRFNDVVHAFRMPGYPFLIAATGGSVKAIRTVQSVIDTSTVLAAVWLARRWLATGTSLLAGAFVALDPLAVYFSSLILTETLFAAMLTWGIACLVHGRSPLSAETRGRHAMWGVGVLLLIGSIYVRPSAIAFPTLLVLAAGIAEARRAGFVAARHRWPIVTGVVLLTALALLPWGRFANGRWSDRWIFTTTNDGFTLYDGWKPVGRWIQQSGQSFCIAAVAQPD